MRFLHLTLAACTLALPALAAETRNVSGFTRVDLAAPLDLEVRPGKFSLTLETDSDLTPYIRTDVEGDRLRISLSGWHGNFRGKQRVKVTMPELRGVVIEGSGDVDIAGFNQQGMVELRIAGSGDVKYSGTSSGLSAAIEGSGDIVLADGQAGSLQGSIRGSGNLKASGFKAKNVSISIDGSGDAEVRVAGGALSASVNGSGDIRWTGEASTLSTATHGSGSIAKR